MPLFLQPGDLAPADAVLMSHVLCGVCGMSATLVVTPTGEQAWDDHMQSHDEPERFQQWSWYVMKMF